MRKVYFSKCILLLFLFTVSSCDKKEEPLPAIEIKSILIKNIGEFNYQDSITYAAIDTVQYELKVITDPEDAEIYHKQVDGEFVKFSGKWIRIDSGTIPLEFYAKKNDYANTGLKKIDFSYETGDLIYDIKLYPNPFDKELTFEIVGKTRGGLNFQVMNRWGQILQSYDEFVSEDKFVVQKELKDLIPGLYIIRFYYGNSTVAKKVIKE